MRVFAVIPVKTLLKSKMRLSTILKPKERRTFVLTMLNDVLNAVKSSEIYEAVVVSSDLMVQRFVSNLEIRFLWEREKGLNQAVAQATEWCIQRKAESVLVLPADIPLITPEDVNQIIHMSSERISIVISPSENGGTNVLLRKPPNVITTCYGPDSFKKHLARALSKGISAKVYTSQRIALDIDSANDLKRFLKVNEQTLSHRFLEQSKINLNICRKPVVNLL